jgi:hypothetical protein
MQGAWSAPCDIALLIWKWNDLLVREKIIRVSMPQVRVLQMRQAVIAVGCARRAPGSSEAQAGVAEFSGGLRCHLSVVRHLSTSNPLPAMPAAFSVSAAYSAILHTEGTIPCGCIN